MCSFKGQAWRERGGLSAAASFLAIQGPQIRLFPQTQITRDPKRSRAVELPLGDGTWLEGGRAPGTPVGQLPPPGFESPVGRRELGCEPRSGALRARVR